jgi:hypothetical protein
MSIARRESEALDQLVAMSCERVDLGALSQLGHMMLGESVSTRLIPSALRWLRRENARGAHIFVRPAGPDQLSFSLIDDLSAEGIAEMKRTGFEPSIVVETSPGNFQAWLKHGCVLDQSTATRTAQELARRFHGDLSSAGWRHFGRLAGFTNQKPHRRLPNGLQPFVKLREASGETFTKAAQFLDEITKFVQQKFAALEARRPGMTAMANRRFIKPPSAFHEDSRYGGDLHRADLAWAIYAASCGLSEERIRDEILYARDLSKKGRPGRQLDYAERTARKAIAAVVQPTR